MVASAVLAALAFAVPADVVGHGLAGLFEACADLLSDGEGLTPEGAAALVAAGSVLVRVPYCVPGRHSQMVITTGAMRSLGPEQVAAVLAHEQAHLRGRHHTSCWPPARPWPGRSPESRCSNGPGWRSRGWSNISPTTSPPAATRARRSPPRWSGWRPAARRRSRWARVARQPSPAYAACSIQKRRSAAVNA
ncbi:hypothetical protein E1294_39770 [Nonomuraea diastatica]|uniref:Peptidase M48 domain-containing protein n=1 Tax=Nonomuraea diastatica TaxID=1848329 RepID=A0A4R4W9L6_9ACTN|nr:hypothetical protein E1294_39770 [Nonomuraea diastatica]